MYFFHVFSSRRVILDSSNIILDVKTGQNALSIEMTSGGGPEIPKFGVFKKAMLQNSVFSKENNSKFLYLYLSTLGYFRLSKYHTLCKTGQNALSIQMTSGCGPEIPKFGVFEKAMLRNVWFSKGDNSQLMFLFLSTPGDFGQSKQHT